LRESDRVSFVYLPIPIVQAQRRKINELNDMEAQQQLAVENLKAKEHGETAVRRCPDHRVQQIKHATQRHVLLHATCCMLTFPNDSPQATDELRLRRKRLLDAQEDYYKAEASLKKARMERVLAKAMAEAQEADLLAERARMAAMHAFMVPLSSATSPS
jgi:hypothetical protein